MSAVTDIKAAVLRLPERQKIQIARWMQAHIPDQTEVDVAVEAEPLELEDALQHSLRSPVKKFKRGHFAALALRGRKAV